MTEKGKADLKVSANAKLNEHCFCVLLNNFHFTLLPQKIQEQNW